MHKELDIPEELEQRQKHKFFIDFVINRFDLESEKKRIAKYFIYSIWAFMFFVLIYDLFYSPGRSVFWFLELSVSIFIYYKLEVPGWVYFLILALFVTNIFGELFLGLFYTIDNFDKWLHLISPIVGCSFFYFIFDNKIKGKRILILFSVTIVLSWALIWEVLEYFFDLYLATSTTGVRIRVFSGREFSQVMDPLTDLTYDSLFTSIGSAVFAILALFITNKSQKTNNNQIQNFNG